MKKRAGMGDHHLAILAIVSLAAYVTGYFTIGKYEEDSGYIEGVKVVDRVFPGRWAQGIDELVVGPRGATKTGSQ